MGDNTVFIVVCYNGEYEFDAQARRWKYLNGPTFYLCVPLDISLDALFDMLYERLGIDRAYQRLSLKVLFSHIGFDANPPMDITDDYSLRLWIREGSSKPNIIFCVSSTQIQQPMIDLNEDDIDLGDDVDMGDAVDMGFAVDLGDDMEGVGESDDEEETGYHVNTFRGCDWEEEASQFHVIDQRVEEIARDPHFNPFVSLHGSTDCLSQPSRGRQRTQYEAQYEAGTSSQHDPCASKANFHGGSFTSFLNAPLSANIYGATNIGVESSRPGSSQNPKPTRLPNYSWRVPTFEDTEIPDYPIGGTFDNDDSSELRLGNMYDSKEEFQMKMRKYALDNNFRMMLSRSERKECYFTCKDDRCKWRVRAKRIRETSKQFQITAFVNTHTCASRVDSNNNRSANTKLIVELLAHKVEQLGNNYKPANVMDDMLKEYGVEINYNQAYNAHEQMRIIVRGSPKECYKILPSYLYILQQANADTIVDLQTDVLGRFSTCSLSLGASRHGFKHCRPILCVDACHLKTRFQWQLFVAIGLDAGDHLFLVAIGVAEVECNDAWGYFMRHLKLAVRDFHREQLSFVSDRHASIKHAIDSEFPDAYHGVCYYHLKGNLNKKWNAHGFCDLTFHTAAYTCSRSYFHIVFDNMKRQCMGAARQLEEIGFERWTRAYFPAKRYAVMTSNYAESFNKVCVGARRWPLPSMIERIRRTLQSWFFKRRNQALACTSDLAPEIEKRIAEIVSQKRNFVVRPVNMDEFEVDGRTRNNPHGVVNLRERTCFCGRFQCLDLPCIHAVVAAGTRAIRLSDLCGVYYKSDCFKNIYMRNIYPVANQEEWDVPEHIKNLKVDLPVSRYAENKSGEPRRGRVNTTRIPSEWERPTTCPIVCGNCKQPGHNRAGCTQYE